MKRTFLGTGIALTLLSACAPKQSQETLTKSGLNPTNYETIVDGVKPVKLYTLKNAAGMEVCVTNFGGRIVSIMVPDKNGNLKDVVLGLTALLTTKIYQATSVLLSDAMPTALIKESS